MHASRIETSGYIVKIVIRVLSITVYSILCLVTCTWVESYV